ncbi:SDR family NAD(P)-dependent oxidoreductase [Micromonospora fluostatini]|uniref:SDR family NAD(P)-dependent oxidoreductase n=1 Tax=Micromonospora sp. JCM 30529 TaxID=3421643 RepID=UPI003D174730
MIDTGLAGRHAVVTGANSPLGIGAATARALAAQGATVTLVCAPGRPGRPDLTRSPGADLYADVTGVDGTAVLDDLRATGATVALVTADLADPSAYRTVLDRAEAAAGPVQILVNNAAYARPDTLLAGGARALDRAAPLLDAAGLDAHLAVNTRAPALLMADFHRRYVDRGATWGRVVNISTDAAPEFPGEVSYGASKHALESLSRTAAREFGPAGVTVNVVAPGPVQTGWLDADAVGQVAALSPLGRVGEPADIADVVVFLCSEQARWVSGQVVQVGGGKRTW